MESNLQNASTPCSVSVNSVTNLNSNQSSNHLVISSCQRNTETTKNNTTNNEETSDESELEEKLLAVYCRAGKLGAAYYTLQTGELYILEEILDRPPDFHIFQSLFHQVEPVRLVLDGYMQGSFVQAAKKTVFHNDSGHEGTCKLVFISSREYSFEACKRRIYTLQLPTEPRSCSDEERIMFLRTAVDFSQTQTVHALGALLRHLDLNWSSISMDLHSKPQFMSLKRISLSEAVSMDAECGRALQVSSPRPHPSGFRGAAREGNSLLQLFRRCVSRVGHARMRILMRHPTSNLETLQRRQDVVEYFMRPQNDSITKNICSSLRFIRNVNGILAKIKALSAKAYQWKSLYNTIYHAVLICEMCENAASSSKFLEELASCDNQKLYEMALYMNRIIDFDLTKSEGKFTVKAGVDPELDMKKQTMASLQGLMSETAKVELQRLPAFVAACSMLYMPHLGYLLAVPVWDTNLDSQQKQLPNMKFMFQNNDYIHYKSRGCEELDVMIGDTYPEIVAHETRIMMRLTTIILENLHTLATVVDMCAELDCLIAMAKVAKENNFVRPILCEEKVLEIEQGRHPLAASTCDAFVPNDTISRPDSCVTILTGPNSCGKSIYMKQIGVIVYLAQVGSCVPAVRARIGVVRAVRTRLRQDEGVAGGLSALGGELRQMALALQDECPSSLVLVDEFGRGTTPADGLALLAACLNTFLFREHRCPHVFLATHYLDIHKYIIKTPIVRYMTLEYSIEEGELVFLYRVVEGSARGQFAGHVAAAAGLPVNVVRRADTLMQHIQNDTLPTPNKKITAKLKSFIEILKNELFSEDI